jgi:hypothetical protein
MPSALLSFPYKTGGWANRAPVTVRSPALYNDLFGAF